MTLSRLPMLMLIAALTTACSPAHLAGRAAGKVAGARLAELLPPPQARLVVAANGGPFCRTMRGLGWPLQATSEDKAQLKRLSRRTREPIVAAQLHGRAECAGWRP